MDPYTPKVGRPSRRSNLTLSAKQYTKVAGTIASVRRDRQRLNGDHNHDDADDYRLQADEPSFIAEKSFVRAPLNSRVPSGNVASKSKGKEKAEPLDKVPVDVQEALILEDLLFVLMGIEGNLITYPQDYSPEEDDTFQGIRFVVSPSLDASLRDLVERILPLATYYTAITSFVEQRSHLDYGLVNHALCAAIRDMLKDYGTLLSQLEHSFTTSPQFSLQKLWFYVHPTLHTLALIYGLVTELTHVDDPNDGSDSASSSSSSSVDPEEQARNEALGLGGAGLKAVLSEINGAGMAAGPVKGGEVLAILHERMLNMSGDPAASALFKTLISVAGRPYATMLDMWMRMGKLDDPYEELCVKESKFIDRGTLEVDYTDEYWERRYTLRDGSTMSADSKRHQAGVPLPRTAGGRLPGGACVPPLLEEWKHKVLLAGKYLNVIRECGIEIAQDKSRNEGGVSMDDEKFYKSIEIAYSFANRTLLNALLRDQKLVSRLRALKRFFFLSHSSFLTHFLDLAHSELRKSAKSVSLIKLQSLLDLALGADTGPSNPTQGDESEDSFKDDAKVSMASSGLYEWLLKVVSVSGVIGGEDEGGGGGIDAVQEEVKKDKDEKDKEKKQMLAIDAFTLDYNVRFPLSLVISRKTILRYQLLFRFLLHLRHVEQSLCAMWLEQNTQTWRKSVSNPELERWRRSVFLLRARMLAFVQQMLAFATFEVLEPNWRALETKLAKVETVDQLLRDHVDFLDTCLKECMLTSSKLLKAFSKLIVTCSTFALYTSSFTKSANQALSALETSGGDPTSVQMEKRWDFLHKFETNFNHWFKVHLDCVQFYASSENVSLLPLVVRLNSVRATS